MIRRLFILVAGVVVLTLGTSAPAFADCHGDGPNSGAGNTFVGPGGSYQNLQWSLSTRKATTWASNTDEALTTYCLDANVDWITTDGHYDKRTARNCDATGNSTRGGIILEPSNWDERDVNGMQKSAGCFYNQTATPTYSGCDYLPGSSCEWQPNQARAWTHKSHAVWLRAENGTVDFNPGGNESESGG